MPFQFIGYRLRYYWRHFLILFIVISATATFIAIEPLYANTLSEGYLRLELDKATPRDFQLSFQNVDAPINESVETSLNDMIGDTLSSISPISRSQGIICPLGVREEDHCHQIISYENYADLLTIVEGRLPQVVVTDSSDAESVLFEVTITPTVAEIIGLTIGDIVVFSEGNATEARFQIVGFMEAIDPERPFWDFEGTFLEGTRTPFGTSFRRDYNIFVLPEVYQETILPLLALDNLSSVYTWRVVAEVSEITAPQLRQQTADLKQLQQDFNQFHPDGRITGTLIPLLNTLRDEIIITETPILMIALIMLLVMLIQVFYVATRLFDAETSEWTILDQRGASPRQLLEMQFSAISVIAIIGAIIAPISALIVLRGLDTIGLLTATFENTDVTGTLLPIESILGSVGVAISCVGVCTLALWLKNTQTTTTNTSKENYPFFLRYYVDIGVFTLGILLMVRLYILTNGNLSESLNTLFNTPNKLTEDIALHADKESLVDPFNLIAPIILMIGLAMFTLRFVPIILKVLGWFGGRFNNLSLPLPLWTSGRGIRVQSVLLILFTVTFAFGTTAYALTATQDNGAWDKARLQTGDTVNLTINPYIADLTYDWESLPDVTHPTIVLNQTANIVVNDITDLTRLTSIVGIDEATFGVYFPEYDQLIAEFQDSETFTLAGIPLPENADRLSLQLYSSTNTDAEPTNVSINVNFRDSAGIPFDVTLETDDAFNVDSFVMYGSQLPRPISPPLRLVSLTLNTERGERREFNHRVFIDDVSITTAEGSSIIIADFETSAISDWQQQPDWRVVNRASERPVVVRNQNISFNGEASLQIDYQVRWAGGRLLSTDIPIAGEAFAPLPIALSRELASYVGSGSSSHQPLEVGNRGEMTFRFGEELVTLDYVLVEILDTFPSRIDGERFLVAPVNALRHYLNWNTTPETYFDLNQVWLNLNTRQASSNFESAITNISGIEDVDYAWARYKIFTSNPLTNAIGGIFYIGFCFGLFNLFIIMATDTSLSDSDEHQSQQILEIFGWSKTHLRLWFILQRLIPMIIALLVGIGLGVSLAYLLLPFLNLITYNKLSIPTVQYLTMFAGIILGVIILLFGLSFSAVKSSSSIDLRQE